jgi:hypothetical protein
MSKESINIQHALNGGEKQILGYKVDGYCEELNTPSYEPWNVYISNSI